MSASFAFDRRSGTVWTYSWVFCDLHDDSVVIRSDLSIEVTPQASLFPSVCRLKIEDDRVVEFCQGSPYALPNCENLPIFGIGKIAGVQFRTTAIDDYIECVFESDRVRLSYEDLINITI